MSFGRDSVTSGIPIMSEIMWLSGMRGVSCNAGKLHLKMNEVHD